MLDYISNIHLMCGEREGGRYDIMGNPHSEATQRSKTCCNERKNLMREDIHWLGHDTFRVKAEKVIVTDPFRIKKAEPCDIILVTHEHYDHCSPEDIKKISGPHTVIVAPPDCSEKLKGEIRTVKPGDSLEVQGIKIEAVPAYNVDKKFHTRERGWVGYIFTANGQRIYIEGGHRPLACLGNICDDCGRSGKGGTRYQPKAGDPNALWLHCGFAGRCGEICRGT
jgi:hypothetical protein